jgi:hypothetical protein
MVGRIVRLFKTEDGPDSLTKSLAAKSIKWLYGIISTSSILLGFDWTLLSGFFYLKKIVLNVSLS